MTGSRMYPHFILLIFVALLSACNTLTNIPKSALHPANNFVVIAHRGASGFLPEHTKEATVLSFMQGADYIEQDIVVSKDNKLVVLHDIYLETVSNVESIFPERKREDGRYYVIDFTVEELRRLRIHERQKTNQQAVYPSRYKGSAHFTIATFAEHVELIAELNRAFNKNIGLFPEIKAASWHESEGVDITALLVAELNRLELNHEDANIYLQSFDPSVLKRLRYEFGIQLKLLQLIAQKNGGDGNVDYDAMRSASGLQQVAKYANAIGPRLSQIIDLQTLQTSELTANAKALNLSVYPYTFRTDVIDFIMKPEEAFTLIKQTGIDGFFTDQVMPYMFVK